MVLIDLENYVYHLCSCIIHEKQKKYKGKMIFSHLLSLAVNKHIRLHITPPSKFYL